MLRGEHRGEMCRRMQVCVTIFLKTDKMLFCEVVLWWQMYKDIGCFNVSCHWQMNNKIVKNCSWISKTDS